MEFSPQFAISELAPLFQGVEAKDNKGLPHSRLIDPSKMPGFGPNLLHNIVMFDDGLNRPMSVKLPARNNHEAECIFALMNGFYPEEYQSPEGRHCVKPEPQHHGNRHDSRPGSWKYPDITHLRVADRDDIIFMLDNLYARLCKIIQRSLEAIEEHTPEDQESLADDMVMAYNARLMTYRLAYIERDYRREKFD